MKYAELISNMTLEEKCSLLSGGTQFDTKDVRRLGIPAMTFSDGPSGLRKQAGAADHLGLNPSLPATCFPSASTLANAWDEVLEETVGAAIGAEAKAQRVNVLLGPGLNLKRAPLCGRNFEYFSEDPYLAGKLAAAAVRGIQSQGIAACPKHLAVNSQETLRMHSDSVIDRRTMEELYLTAFEIAVTEGKPKVIMPSYNRINGVYASEHKELLQDTLRERWGFEGFAVTDWGGSNDRVSAVLAGTHVEMPTTGGDSDREVARAVRAGELDEAVLDQRVDEYLRVLFDTVIPENAPTEFDEEGHHTLARRAAGESIVLLKNDGRLLPLRPGQRAAVIGDFAAVPRYQGSGSSAVNPTRVDTPLDCLKSSGLDIVGYAPGFRRHGGEDNDLLREAVELARRAEVVLLYLGLDELAESEGVDRPNMTLRQNQVELLRAVSEVNPKVVVVLAGGAPVETPWLDRCQALIHGYLGGQAGAGAMVDALTGKIVPSGKLAESWPMTYTDVACAGHYPAPERTAEYREGPFVGYRYYDKAGIPVRFPFGFGLSYTTFTYSDLKVSENEVTFTLANSGSYSAAEVAQLYVGKTDSELFRPLRELKGFTKVFLQPGESRQVTIPLDDKAFRFFDISSGDWAVEKGTYQIFVGPSSADLPLSGTITVAGVNGAGRYDREALACYYSGQVKDVPDSAFQALLGRPIPDSRWDRESPLELNDTFAQLQYAKGWVGRLVYRVTKKQVDKGTASGHPDLNALFRYNMPVRAIAKMTGGMVTMKMAEAVLELFNGRFFGGVGHLIRSLIQRRKARKDTAKALGKEN